MTGEELKQLQTWRDRVRLGDELLEITQRAVAATADSVEIEREPLNTSRATVSFDLYPVDHLNVATIRMRLSDDATAEERDEFAVTLFAMLWNENGVDSDSRGWWRKSSFEG